MSLRVVGAGLPRTGTSSLRAALEQLLGGRCLHMSALPGHPFDLGPDWDAALDDEPMDWARLTEGFVAAVDWPASLFWRELWAANPQALVLLSTRDTPAAWYRSFNEMVLAHARQSAAPDWTGGRGLVRLLERFTGTRDWDDAATLMAAYEAHNAAVRRAVPAAQLLDWQAPQGWGPLCQALGLPEPAVSFPHIDGRPR